MAERLELLIPQRGAASGTGASVAGIALDHGQVEPAQPPRLRSAPAGPPTMVPARRARRDGARRIAPWR